jgi:hypothetical protein
MGVYLFFVMDCNYHRWMRDAMSKCPRRFYAMLLGGGGYG